MIDAELGAVIVLGCKRIKDMQNYLELSEQKLAEKDKQMEMINQQLEEKNQQFQMF